MTMSSRRLINSGRKWPLIRAMMASRTESGILGEHEHSAVGSSTALSLSSSSEEGALGSPTRFFIFLVGGEDAEERSTLRESCHSSSDSAPRLEVRTMMVLEKSTV